MDATTWIPKGFLLAAAVNVGGVLLFSRGLTNAYLSELYPQVFSVFGLVVIVLWGLAYLAVANSHREARWIVAVFAVEKLAYFGTWAFWLARHGSELPLVFETSPLTWTFYVIYGPNDLAFGVFFAWVFFRARPGRSASQEAR